MLGPANGRGGMEYGKRKFYFGYLRSKDHSYQADLEKPLKDRVDVQHVGHFHLNQTTHKQPASTTQREEDEDVCLHLCPWH